MPHFPSATVRRGASAAISVSRTYANTSSGVRLLAAGIASRIAFKIA